MLVLIKFGLVLMQQCNENSFGMFSLVFWVIKLLKCGADIFPKEHSGAHL